MIFGETNQSSGEGAFFSDDDKASESEQETALCIAKTCVAIHGIAQAS